MHALLFCNAAPRVEAMSLDRWDIVEKGAFEVEAETTDAAATLARLVASPAVDTVPATSVDVERERD